MTGSFLQDQERVILIERSFYFFGIGKPAFKPPKHFVQHKIGFRVNR
jgi:hypothetical protein